MTHKWSLNLFFGLISISLVSYLTEAIAVYNQTVNARQTTHLKCPFIDDEVNDKTVTWIRKKDGHILTNGFIKYTNDTRIAPHFQNNHWILQIQNVSKGDVGVYECALTSNDNQLVSNDSALFRLNVFDSKFFKKEEFDNLLHILDVNDEQKAQKIEQVLEKAESVLRRAEEPNGELNPAVIVNEFLPDPMPVKDFNISEDGGLTYFEGTMKNMTIHGLKQLKINKLLFNLGLIQLKVIMEIPVISLQGLYEIDGKVTFFPFYGEGEFYMNVTDIEITAYSSLEKNANGTIKVGDIDLDVYTDNIDLHMDNLMGGGVMGGITNSVINELSGMIFSHIKSTMLDEASQDIKTMINTQLAHLPLDFVDEKSATIFDGVLDRAKLAINESGLDPMLLPAFRDKFDYKFFVFHVKGDLKVFNGNLSGLSSLVRTGDIIATYKNNEVMFEARMGFNNLTGGYDWSTNVMGGGPSGSASINIAGISCYLRVKQSLKKGAKPTIDSFRIEQIKHLWVDVNGLGSWDFILEIIINLMTNAFKLSLANAISGPVTEAIQKELNEMPISLL